VSHDGPMTAVYEGFSSQLVGSGDSLPVARHRSLFGACSRSGRQAAPSPLRVKHPPFGGCSFFTRSAGPLRQSSRGARIPLCSAPNEETA
jgi:hypothetical protein